MYNERKNQRSAMPIPHKRSLPSQRVAPTDEDSPVKRIVCSSLIGVGVIAGCGLLLLSIVCFIALSCEDPLSMIAPLSLLALLPSNFLGGLVASKKSGSSPLACGAVTAAIWLTAAFIFSLCLFKIPSSSYALWQSILLHAASALFCIFGSFAGRYKPQKNIKKKKRFGR